MPWFTLSDGTPPEPSYDDLLAGRNQPQPSALLTRLFQELAGTTLEPSTELGRTREVSYEETARGYCGDPDLGYVWEGVIPVNDTSLPITETYVTHGLPGASLVWSVAYRKQGQLGFATWTCNHLYAGLDDHARDIVERVWADTFGVDPVFDPVSPENEQGYEEFGRERADQFRAYLHMGE